MAGVVRSWEGAPVEGATVTTDPVGEPAEVLSAADGTFLLPCVPAGLYRLIASHPEHGSRQLDGRVPSGLRLDDIAVRLVPVLAVTGRVIDAQEQPFAGVSLILRERGDGTPPLASATSGADGTFRFGGVAPGGYVIDADHPDAQLEVTIPAKGGAEVVVRLARSPVVIGQVLEPLAGDPVAAEVMVLHEQRGETAVRRVPTDAGGRFRASHFTGGKIWLLARHPLHRDSEMLELIVASGELREGIELRLRAGVAISGVVVDGRGDPLAGVQVTARPVAAPPPPAEKPEERPTVDGSRSATTSVGGGFEVRGLAPGDHHVDLAHEAHGRKRVAEPVAAATSGHRFVLARGATVRGRVVRETGEVVPGIGVHLALVRAAVDESGAPRLLTAATNAGGRFELSGAALGEWTLRAGEPGRPLTPGRELSVTAPGLLDVGDLMVTLTSCSVSGLVRNPMGDPLPRARVECSTESGPVVTDCDEEGRFRFDDLPWGSLELLATMKGQASRAGRTSVQCGDDDVELVLEGLSWVSGLVTDDAGTPVRRFQVTLLARTPTGEEVAIGSQFFDPPDGSFQLQLGATQVTGALPIEAVLVSVRRFRWARHEVGTVDPFTGTDLGVLVLPRPGRVRGRVVDPAGRGLAGAQVWLELPAGIEPRPLRTNPEGNFELRGVVAGRQRLLAQHTQFAPEATEVEIEAGKTLTGVEIRLPIGATLEGMLGDLHGAPLAEHWIEARPLAGPGLPRRAQADSTGRYRLTGLGQGRHRLRVLDPAAEVPLGEPEDLELSAGEKREHQLNR